MKRLLKKLLDRLRPTPEPEPVWLTGEQALAAMGGTLFRPVPPPTPDIEALDILVGMGYGLLRGDVGVSFSVGHYSPDSVARAVAAAQQLGFRCEARNGAIRVRHPHQERP